MSVELRVCVCLYVSRSELDGFGMRIEVRMERQVSHSLLPVSQ